MNEHQLSGTLLLLLMAGLLAAGLLVVEKLGSKALGPVGIGWCLSALLVSPLIPLLGFETSTTLLLQGILKFMLLSVGLKLLVVRYCEDWNRTLIYCLGITLPFIGLMLLIVVERSTNRVMAELVSLGTYGVIVLGVTMLSLFVERIAGSLSHSAAR